MWYSFNAANDSVKKHFPSLALWIYREIMEHKKTCLRENQKRKKKKEHHAAEVCYEHFMDVAKMCNVKRKVEHLLARNV